MNKFLEPEYFKIKLLLLSLISMSMTISYGQSIEYSGRSKVDRSQEFMAKTEDRIRDLELNIRTIGDKNVNDDIRLNTINATVKYFISEKNEFEVSSLNRKNPRSFEVRKYLSRLMTLDYRKVEIEWFESQWVTKFRKAPNGKYYGVIRIFQRFKGYGTDNTILYKDTTIKDIEVELDVLKMNLGNDIKEVLDIRLGDVRVTETS